MPILRDLIRNQKSKYFLDYISKCGSYGYNRKMDSEKGY
jgi:hypothetical protein